MNERIKKLLLSEHEFNKFQFCKEKLNYSLLEIIEKQNIKYKAWDLVQLLQGKKVPERKLTAEWVEYMRDKPWKRSGLTNRTCDQLLEFIKNKTMPKTEVGQFYVKKFNG